MGLLILLFFMRQALLRMREKKKNRKANKKKEKTNSEVSTPNASKTQMQKKKAQFFHLSLLRTSGARTSESDRATQRRWRREKKLPRVSRQPSNVADRCLPINKANLRFFRPLQWTESQRQTIAMKRQRKWTSSTNCRCFSFVSTTILSSLSPAELRKAWRIVSLRFRNTIANVQFLIFVLNNMPDRSLWLEWLLDWSFEALTRWSQANRFTSQAMIRPSPILRCRCCQLLKTKWEYRQVRRQHEHPNVCCVYACKNKCEECHRGFKLLH